MRVFFQKMGIEKVRFKPAYNPYTEVGFFSYSSKTVNGTLTLVTSRLLKSSHSIPCWTDG